MKFYKDNKYWNDDLRPEFNAETRGLWETTHGNKYTGRIFQDRGGLASNEFSLTMQKVDREMIASVQKHGPVSLPNNSHFEDFYDRVDKKKEEIARYWKNHIYLNPKIHI